MTEQPFVTKLNAYKIPVQRYMNGKYSTLAIFCIGILFIIVTLTYVHESYIPFKKIVFQDFVVENVEKMEREWQDVTEEVDLSHKLCYDLFDDGVYSEGQKWTPSKCNMHLYNKLETARCMELLEATEKRPLISFIGEARLRRLAMEFVSLFTTRPVNTTVENDRTFELLENSTIGKIESLWRYEVNDTMIQDLINYSKLPENEQPKVIVIGAALHSLMIHLDDTSGYRNNLTKLAGALRPLKNTIILWMWQQRVQNHYLYGQAKMITNGRLHNYNMVAKEVLSATNAYIWESSRVLSLQYNDDFIDGIQQGPFGVNIDAQMLINLLCNDIVKPEKATCCMNEKQVISKKTQ